MNAVDAPFRDASRSIETRVEDLLQRMTLAAKVAQLGGTWSTTLVEDGTFSPGRAAKMMPYGSGHVTRIAGASGLRPREIAALSNAIQLWLRDHSPLGIPTLIHEEATGGLTARDADQLPHGIGLASTWDPPLVERGAELIRRQMLAVGARLALAPVLDIARDPRWGRVEETYGEDPFLASRIGVAFVRGLQGADLSEGVAATGKHFIGYGLSEGGHNHKPVHLGPRELRDAFAAPFRAAIDEAGLACVMNAYNDVDGLPCGASPEILTDLLRNELGFEGLVVADYFTPTLLIHAHRIAANRIEAAILALEAGLDVELPDNACFSHLVEAVEQGRISIELIDRALRRNLALKFRLGLFENPFVAEARAPEVFQTVEARTLARQLAQRSMVLLRNQGGLLPLDPIRLRRIAVLGPAADDMRLLEGDYHYPAHLEIIYRSEKAGILPRPDQATFQAGPFFPPMKTPLEGIREAVHPDCEILHLRGCGILSDDASGITEASALARTAEVALVFVGGRSGLVSGCTSGEFRDASDLGLTGQQQRLVEEIIATGTPTIVVLLGGRILALPWIAENVPAILEAFLPGEEGGSAIADLLFGAVSPSGRLPVSMPRSVGQLPVRYDRKWNGTMLLGMSSDYTDAPAGALFPFGHGLTYGRFEYADLKVAPEVARSDKAVKLSFTLRNLGEHAAEEVVQVYAHDVLASVTRPFRQLVAFARIPLEPGASTRVQLEVNLDHLAFHDAHLQRVVEPGKFEFHVGPSSADTPLSASFILRD